MTKSYKLSIPVGLNLESTDWKANINATSTPLLVSLASLIDSFALQPIKSIISKYNLAHMVSFVEKELLTVAGNYATITIKDLTTANTMTINLIRVSNSDIADV
jgi:hypothetical protein